MRHRLVSVSAEAGVALDFEGDGGLKKVVAQALVLALGGGSWPETGATGEWREMLERCGVAIRPFQASNCGWEVAWPAEVLEKMEGRPLKNISASAGAEKVRGELLVTRYGLEGGALYALGGALRGMQSPLLTVDFKPDSSEDSLVARLGSARTNYLEEGAARWRLGDPVRCLLKALRGAAPFQSGLEAARFVKACPIVLSGPRPLSEAISTAGGVDWRDLDGNLMLRGLPGVFLAGEMVDWDAPTGGYLMQGCFATGTRAGARAAQYLGGE
jgi:uncharacterized flavoprotein (TIGR03862 family)